ncbi:hypothetical protein BUALT_Bualt18G0062600 [Buddleja alternifolia]|uniref:CCHC-type domain-containing protein n=1 Tax=Buddleja alternifolia TaxID=168488 RepID=A0AAV6W4W1_9LAMI|nr:hypothetical protein BUALT_Bualt18G0062600 [Buddleja alternifolia]
MAFRTSVRLPAMALEKIPRDLTEASLSGAGLSIIAALSLIFLFGMELNDYLSVSTSTSVVIDKTLSCEFASVDVSDVLGTNRLNITKTVRKYSIDSNLKPTGSEFWSGPTAKAIKHDVEDDEEYGEGSVVLNAKDFDRISHQHAILVVNFFAPWCYWSNRLTSGTKAKKWNAKKWKKGKNNGATVATKIQKKAKSAKGNCFHCKEDGHWKRNCPKYLASLPTKSGKAPNQGQTTKLCFDDYGDRDTDSLVKTMEDLVAPISLQSQKASDSLPAETKDNAKRPAPLSGGCRIEGFVRVKKVPGNLIISARSASHSFDASQMNMSHAISHFSFGKKISPRVMSDLKRLLPYLGGSYDRLTGLSYISNPSDSSANVTVAGIVDSILHNTIRMIQKVELGKNF